MKIASHREIGLIGIGLRGSTSLDLSVYGNFPLLVQLQIGIFYKRCLWRPSDVLLVFMVLKHV